MVSSSFVPTSFPSFQSGGLPFPLQTLLSLLILVQVGYIITVSVAAHRRDGHSGLYHDLRFPIGLVNLGALVFAHFLETASHPLLPHSSTPLLFWSLFSILLSAVSVRSAFIRHAASSRGIALAFFIFLIFRTVFLVAFFLLELLGPQGWEGMGWRDFVPFVESRGKVKLGEDEEQSRNGQQQDEDGEWIQEECPRERANIFQVLTFSWMTPMMKQGKAKFLTEEDLWALPVGAFLSHCERKDLSR
jgi:ATP-binding cassette subfamily C (CFTR/MRP) protein 1